MTDPGLDAIRARLEAIAEDLTELALDRLRTGVDALERDDPDAAALAAEERRLTQARRSVERAIAILAAAAAD